MQAGGQGFNPPHLHHTGFPSNCTWIPPSCPAIDWAFAVTWPRHLSESRLSLSGQNIQSMPYPAGGAMTAEIDIPIEDKIVEVLQQLGIERAHFASRGLNDWHGLAASYPQAVASLTLVCPLGFDSQTLAPLADRLLVFNADSGGASETIGRNMATMESASLVFPTCVGIRLGPDAGRPGRWNPAAWSHSCCSPWFSGADG